MWPLERAWEGWRRRGSSSRAEGEERHGCGKMTEMRYWKCSSVELGLGSTEGKEVARKRDHYGRRREGGILGG